jgi:hypothetical protein
VSDTLNRVHAEIEAGLDEIEYRGYCFGVCDNDKGWTYTFEGGVFGSLDEVIAAIDEVAGPGGVS